MPNSDYPSTYILAIETDLVINERLGTYSVPGGGQPRLWLKIVRNDLAVMAEFRVPFKSVSSMRGGTVETFLTNNGAFVPLSVSEQVRKILRAYTEYEFPEPKLVEIKRQAS